MRATIPLVFVVILLCIGLLALYSSERQALPPIPTVILEESPTPEEKGEAELVRAYESAQSSGNAGATIREASRLARWLESHDRADEALRLLDEHIDVAAQTPGGASYVILTARLFSSQGDDASAESTLQDGIRRSRSRDGSVSWNEVELLLELGEFWMSRHDLDDAEEAFSLILERAGESAGPVTLDAAWHGLQVVEEQRGDERRALDYCLRRYELAWGDSDQASLDAATRDCVRLLDNTGDAESADRLWKRARARLTERSAEETSVPHGGTMTALP